MCIRDSILLYLTGTPANLLSLGAVDFGIIIDSTIIVIENIYRHMTRDTSTTEDEIHCIRRASVEVGGPMLYSTLIFIIAFLPLFTMKGVEGVIFSPMSHTYAFALTTAIILAVTLTPVLSSYFLKKGMKETHNIVWESFHHFYHNLFVRILRRPRLTLVGIGLIMAAGLSFFPYLGGEFLPKLEEGNIWARATLPLTTSLSNADQVAGGARRVFKSFPEVTNVISQTGRPDDGADTTGFFNIEFFVDLKPEDQWRKGLNKEKLVNQVDEKMRGQFPGINFGYSQNIEDNVEEALSGVKGVNAVKIYGPDLSVDERVANEVNEVISGVPGIADTAVYRAMGQPNLTITPDRAACSRYGLNVGDVNSVVQAAIGGQAVTQVLQGERAFNLVVRWLPKYRQSLDAIKQIRVATPIGGYVPLSQSPISRPWKAPHLSIAKAFSEMCIRDRVKIVTNPGSALVVPQAALVFDGNSYCAFVRGSGDSIERRTVEIGSWNEHGYARVTSGLKAGGVVIVHKALQMNALWHKAHGESS